ncbi:MAG: TlyA family RNA methyltransferase [Anaerolineae bacterium]
MSKERLDELVYRRGLAESREKARRLILAGKVKVAGELGTKAGMLIAEDKDITVEASSPFVSRGGSKLEHALRVFNLNVNGWLAADVGASTGGFTDCLLQNGARKVYALDVGRGQLAWKLRQDSRVIAREQVNVRYLTQLEELVDLVVIDVSFISLQLILPVVANWLREDGKVVALIKPQFEAGKELVGKGGVIRDPEVHRQVLAHLLAWMGSTGWQVRGLTASPLIGPAGNREFLVYLQRGEAADTSQLTIWIDPLISTKHPIGTI